MARRTESAPQTARSRTRQHARSAATTRRPIGVAGAGAPVPQPREDTESISSGHPIMHWVLVTDENGRTRPEARWF